MVNVPPAGTQAGIPSPGSHTLLGQEDQHGISPAVTSPIDTQASGSSFIVFNGGYASNTEPPTDNKGNTWTPLGPPVVYNGYGGAFDIKAYISLSARGGAAHTVSIVKNGYAAGELSLPFVELRNAGILQDIAQNYPAQGPRATSGRVITTGPATLIALWWGDAPHLVNSAIPGNGFTLIDSFVDLPPNSGVQVAVAYRQVGGPGTYDVTWTQSPDQGAVLWLLAFESDFIFVNGFE
ncbi:hypothetical protein [Dokdonella soli]|uniref:Uncharacterized protein n=1 Tax=Dokdonella soli TaxID=529810 RepID=A0ABP3TXQ9_9GAMM